MEEGGCQVDPMQAEDAFAAFVRGRSAALARTAFLLTGDHHRGEDLLQVALIKAAKAWERIADEPEAYVRRILYHESISAWRRRRWREVTVADTSTTADPASGSSDVDLRLALVDALARLTPKQRAVLVLRYFEDLTEAQTATALGIGIGTVKSQTRQALQRLRAVAPDLAELVGTGGDR